MTADQPIDFSLGQEAADQLTALTDKLRECADQGPDGVNVAVTPAEAMWVLRVMELAQAPICRGAPHDTMPAVDLEGLERLTAELKERAAEFEHAVWTCSVFEPPTAEAAAYCKVLWDNRTLIETTLKDALAKRALSATPETTSPIETAELLTAMADTSGYGEGRSATPLSQVPAGQGVGVEERTKAFWDHRCGMGLSPALTPWRELHVFDRANLVAAMQAADAAQPTQDDAKRLREALSDSVVAAAMEDAWSDFTSDTGCFPGDFSITRGPQLHFKAGTWADLVAMYLRAALTPTSKTGDTDHAPATFLERMVQESSQPPKVYPAWGGDEGREGRRELTDDEA